MSRGILLAGNESLLFSSIAGEAGKRTEKFGAASIQGPSAFSAENAIGDSGKKIPLVWNPGSSISGRTLLLSAENQLSRISDIILICSPPPLYSPVESLVPANIENHFSTQIKGWFFLAREIAIYFRERGSGTLALAIGESPPRSAESISDFPGAAAAASFRALAQELVFSAAGRPFLTMGFSFSEPGQENEFAAWMFKIIDEGSRKNSGKWHKFSKPGFFRKKSQVLP